ncbi:MAG TPA: ribonuclease Y [Patescibacteria group bacterium]|nr:ribonuclease Y [Patescibacteria group bacterium]
MVDTLDIEKKLLEKQEKLEELKESLDREKQEYKEKLQQLSHMTETEAKDALLEETEKSEAAAVAKLIKEREEAAKATADTKAQEVLVEAMRHGAIKYVAEFTVSIIRVESEEVKGRIIGKEGRNIRAFESATGVDIDLDEEGVIRLSSFDSIRREIARRALEVLLKDTRIQPFRIEEVVNQTKLDLEKIMQSEGEKLAHEAGVFNLPVDLIKTLGRFKFRTSYGQNLISHSLEVSKIAVGIAQEIGADVDVVRLGGLLHDIGKVVEGEGSHVKLGVELLKRFGLPEQIINTVAQHHEDKPFTSVESVIVHIADQVSGGRPGARYEDVEKYANRLKEMEDMAKSYEGVEDAYAFEAGRELRVIINPGKLDDAQTVIIAKKLRDEISKSLAIPGEVKVTAIREFRAIVGENL